MIPSKQTDRRTKYGAYIVACTTGLLTLTLLQDVLLFGFVNIDSVQLFVERNPNLLIDGLWLCLLGCIVTFMASFFADGIQRAIGLILSVVTFLACTPLRAGY